MKHINKAMKKYELGQKVYVKNILIRNGYRPTYVENYSRYFEHELNKKCIYAGKRVINFKGYTDYGDDYYYFEPVEKMAVHLVVVSYGQLAYVVDDEIEEE